MLGPVDLQNVTYPEDGIPSLDWVICGGETGPGAREMRLEWVGNLRDQCLDAGIPFFFKQWGGVHKKAVGRELDGRTWDEIPSSLER